MKTLKRINLNIALLVAAIFFVFSSLSAQQRKEQGPPPLPNETQINKMVEDLTAELSLSETQKTEIFSLYKDHFAEAKTLMNTGQRPSREKMENLRTIFENKVKSLLNDEQQDLFDEYIKNNKPRLGKGRERQQNRRK